MAKNKEIRFCVGNEERTASPAWKLFINKNDTYLLARLFGRVTKISFHKSGDCRLAFITIQKGEKSRLVMQWSKEYNELGIAPNLEIIVPNVNIENPLNKNIEKNKNEIIYINPPLFNHKTIVKVYFKKNKKFKHFLPKGFKCLFESELDSGESICLITSEEKMSMIEMDILSDERKKIDVNVSSLKQKKNIESVFAIHFNEGSKKNQPTALCFPLGLENIKIN